MLPKKGGNYKDKPLLMAILSKIVSAFRSNVQLCYVRLVVELCVRTKQREKRSFM